MNPIPDDRAEGCPKADDRRHLVPNRRSATVPTTNWKPSPPWNRSAGHGLIQGPRGHAACVHLRTTDSSPTGKIGPSTRPAVSRARCGDEPPRPTAAPWPPEEVGPRPGARDECHRFDRRPGSAGPCPRRYDALVGHGQLEPMVREPGGAPDAPADPDTQPVQWNQNSGWDSNRELRAGLPARGRTPHQTSPGPRETRSIIMVVIDKG